MNIRRWVEYIWQIISKHIPWRSQCIEGMWYLRKVSSSCEQFGPVSKCLFPKYITFRFQNLRNGREDKNGRRSTTFGLDNKKQFPIYFPKIELFFIFETKSSLSTPIFIFSTIPQSLKTKFDVHWTQTCINPKLIKFANFLSIACPEGYIVLCKTSCDIWSFTI